MEKAPTFARFGVVGDIQVVQQVFSCLRFEQLGAAQMKHSRTAVWLLVDLMDDAVADGHGFTSEWRRPPVAGGRWWQFGFGWGICKFWTREKKHG